MIFRVAAYGVSFIAIILINLLFNSAFGEYGQALWFVAFIVLSGLVRLGVGIGKKRKAALDGSLPDSQLTES
jgi:hypothetical protein